MRIRRLEDRDRAWLDALLQSEWGGDTLIVRGTERPLANKPTLVAGEREGVAIFEPGDPGELLLLHALRQNQGIGTALLNAVIAELRAAGTRELLVATTNDNTAALRFYQRRGFRLHRVRIGGVDEARRLKPSIPLLGLDRIPMRDEFDLVLDL